MEIILKKDVENLGLENTSVELGKFLRYIKLLSAYFSTYSDDSLLA